METKKILIIKPSAMGDVVQALPLLRTLRRAFPHAHIAWVVNRSCADVLSGHPHLDEVVPFDRRAWSGVRNLLSASAGLTELVRGLRRRKFDLALDLQGLFRSGLITLLSGASMRMGFADAREFATIGYNRTVHTPTRDMHAVDRYMLFARELGLPADGEPEFVLPMCRAEADWAEEFVAGLRAERGPLVLVNPSARWATKRWPATRFAELIDSLVRVEGAVVVLTGSDQDRPVVERVRRMSAENSIDLVGKTSLKQLVALLRRSDMLVCNDSGPMHLAAALGTPVLAFFGPTSPVRTGPYGEPTRCVVLRKELSCSPCYRRDCRRLRCLEAITSEEATEAAVNLLELNRTARPGVRELR